MECYTNESSFGKIGHVESATVKKQKIELFSMFFVAEQTMTSSEDQAIAIQAKNLRMAMMTEISNIRHERGISQKKLEELSGVKQPVIARMEKGHTSPQLDTILKVLERVATMK